MRASGARSTELGLECRLLGVVFARVGVFYDNDRDDDRDDD